MPVVVIDDRTIVREPSIVVEASLRAHEQPCERRRPIELLVRRAARLEVVYSDLFRGMHRPSRLGKQWRDVATPAAAFPLENDLSSGGSRAIIRVLLRLGRRN